MCPESCCCCGGGQSEPQVSAEDFFSFPPCPSNPRQLLVWAQRCAERWEGRTRSRRGNLGHPFWEVLGKHEPYFVAYFVAAPCFIPPPRCQALSIAGRAMVWSQHRQERIFFLHKMERTSPKTLAFFLHLCQTAPILQEDNPTSTAIATDPARCAGHVPYIFPDLRAQGGRFGLTAIRRIHHRSPPFAPCTPPGWEAQGGKEPGG